MFKQFLLAAVLFATPAFACQEDVAKIPGLNDQERAALVQKCEAAKTEVKAAVTEAVAEPEKVAKQVSTATTEAVSVGKQAAEVVKEVAKELSIAVNEFITTPVGVLATGVAVWYFAGDEVGSVIGAIWDMLGGVILFIIATIAGSAVRRSLMFKETVDHTVKGWFGSEKVVSVKSYHTFSELKDDMQFGVCLCTLAQVILYTLGFTMIF